jgi:hypothetical protein
VARHRRDQPRAGRSIYVLGTSCGTLAVAALVSAVQPLSQPVTQADREPAGQEDLLSALEDLRFPLDRSGFVGGPLEIPQIGAVLDDYEERYAALDAARAAEKSAAEQSYDQPALEDFLADERPPTPAGPTPPPAPPAMPPAPAAPPPTPAGEAPPVEPPALQPPAAPAVTDPTPPAPPPPPSTTTPTETPAEEPETPTEQPPPPADESLALEERYEHRDSDGNVDFTITLVHVDATLICTAAGHLPAENGHLIGLQVKVADPTPPAEGEPPIDAADFRFVGADGEVTKDVDTASSAGCLENGWPEGRPGPGESAAGTVVLDVPALTGTVVYRPKAWSSGVRWQF